ncbi:unnamed protein product [Peniophora sp. CBMAI 1063]|nr:unnamed protein product [Peniophora sp. CBMAI 1063]
MSVLTPFFYIDHPLSDTRLSPGTLQADVLEEIFARLAAIDPPKKQHGDPFSDSQFHLGWIYVTHVCRHWRSVGTDLATLWAGIVCSLPNASAMGTVLQRSKGCTLNFAIEDVGALEAKIGFALDHLERAQNFSCTSSYVWDDCRALTQRSLPALRHLSLSQNIEGMDMSITRTIGLDAPRLQSLSLENAFFSLARPSDPLHDLHTLDLRGPCALPHPAWGLLEVLSKTPRLEHLRFQMLLFHHSQGGLWREYPGGVVKLNHLKAVALTGGPHADIAGFWSRIYAPDNIDIYVNFRADPPGDLVIALDHQLQCPSHNTVVVNLARSRHLSVSTFTLEPVARSRVILDGGGGATLALLADIDSHVRLGHIIRLSVQLYAPYTWDDAPLLVLARKCSSVRELTLHTDNADNLALLAPVDEQASPLFPLLESLSVQFDPSALKSDEVYRQWWSRLRDVLSRRSAAEICVQTLRLHGRWGWRDAGIEVIDEEMMVDLRNLALVKKVVDDRVW